MLKNNSMLALIAMASLLNSFTFRGRMNHQRRGSKNCLLLGLVAPVVGGSDAHASFYRKWARTFSGLHMA
jgi:hypothetical protein